MDTQQISFVDPFRLVNNLSFVSVINHMGWCQQWRDSCLAEIDHADTEVRSALHLLATHLTSSRIVVARALNIAVIAEQQRA